MTDKPTETVERARNVQRPHQAVETAALAMAKVIVATIRDTAAETRHESGDAADAMIGIAEAIEEKMESLARDLSENYARALTTAAGDEAYANGDALPPGTIDLRAAETNEALAWLDGQQSEGASKAASVIRAMRLAYRDQAVAAASGPDAGEMSEALRPMSEWDKRDETVLLLVDYSEGEHPLDDADIAITIGHNEDHNVGEGEGAGWKFAGWCWTHDHYVEGKGKPIGWMPLPYHLARRGRAAPRKDGK